MAVHTKKVIDGCVGIKRREVLMALKTLPIDEGNLEAIMLTQLFI